ncbi:uncharacterized protein LOC108701737 [Xenopus laevis]|uniref:Uncharacterized protein LOC108701737 n=2 Tax=Xenopus laevis TaxID=8355 RepID=A0A1L8EZ87_XENLA|nr:uncharacterized protein LOC108701737 [Xenopus laevis]XP_041433056.1 uncharacterized protein LOC108701737 [Xenopus laevis]OCT64657.1 hypothetical protein XELAEV_18045756mg [Xenopus laevis]
MAPPRQFTVGIFSRDGEDSYKWLINMLKDTDFRDVVKDVLPIYISNNFPEFLASVSQCQFAILYHSKNRGRLNVTDVTDSLYDEELKYLSAELGKEHTIVVIDDLEDSSDEIKESLLADQPCIKQNAQEILLISQQEKKSPNEEMMKKKHQMMDIMAPKKKGKKKTSGKKSGSGQEGSDGQGKNPRDEEEEKDTKESGVLMPNQTLQGQHGVRNQTGPRKSQGLKCCCII